jgi:hypothetical protein
MPSASSSQLPDAPSSKTDFVRKYEKAAFRRLLGSNI